MSVFGEHSPTVICTIRHCSRRAERLSRGLLNWTWAAVIVALAFTSMACSSEDQTSTSVPEESLPASEDPTAAPDVALRLFVPQGTPATIDGVFTPGEWDGALSINLANGELLLMHAGDYLYVGIRSDRLGLGSLCVVRDGEISILHSSAALGTATYVKDGESWRKTRDFFWTNRDTSNSQQALEERREHLESENWLASNGLMGNYNEMEYQIALTDGQLQLAATYLLSPEYTTADYWPEELGTGCRDFEPLQDDPPDTVDFAPETWMTIIAADE